jgi:3-hydroxybutyryl-CoA dehydrogenase
MPKGKIIVIGAGVMGQGLAEAIAASGNDVVLVDKTTDLAQKGVKGVSESLDREILRWGLTKSDKKAILSRILPTSDLNEAAKAETVITAVCEDLDTKRNLLRQLDTVCSADAVFVTITATLPVSEIAAASEHPERVVGMHFLNPVTRIPVVEIVKGLKTSQATFEKAVGLAQMLDKKWINVSEYPGFITTRIIVPLLNEAMNVVMEGIAGADDIDDAMKLGFGFNVGPLTLADMMGLDVVLSWTTNLSRELNDAKFGPCPLLRKMVLAGELGVKSGKGFFEYDSEGNKVKSGKAT